MSAYTEYGRNGEKWTLYKIWHGKLWYFNRLPPGNGKLADKIIWTDNAQEAKPLDQATAEGYRKTLAQPHSKTNGAIGILPWHEPAQEPAEG